MGDFMQRYLLHIKGYIVLSLLMNFLEIVATSIILLFPGWLASSYMNGDKNLAILSLLYMGIFSIYLVIAYFSNRIADYRRIKFEQKIKQDFFEAIINKSYSNFYKYDVGEYISMQANDITQMCQSYLSPLLAVFRSVIMILVFGVALMIFTDVLIAMVIIFFSCFIVLVPKITAKKLADKNELYLSSLGKYTSSVQKYFKSYDILDKKGSASINSCHNEKLSDVMNKNMQFRKVNSFAMVINGGVVEFISVITFIVVGILLYQSQITVGMATIAFTYSTRFMEPIFELNLNIGRVKSVKEIKEKLVNIIAEDECENRVAIERLHKVNVDNVQKQLDDVVLHYDNLEFDFSKKYLITGENGAGKSVLLKLIMGFLTATSGKISYNGNEFIDVSEHISYVPQEPVIFEGTYIENVTIYGTYGTENLANYELFFPKEVINNIKSNKTLESLSSGEKQVVALIRALCSEKEFILLDEPLAVMNQVTIKKFMETFVKLDRTVVMVAHNIDEYKDRFDLCYTVRRAKS